MGKELNRSAVLNAVRMASADRSGVQTYPQPVRKQTSELDALIAQAQMLNEQIAKATGSAPKTAAKKDDAITVSYDEYKGNEMITIQRGNGRPFSFGRSKAQMIVESIDAIRSFASGE